MDLVEVNEAFAPQFLAVVKELGLDMEKTNVNGGAIALGHPLGASGARITTHLVYELARRNGRYAVGSACIGGGQGISIILEIDQELRSSGRVSRDDKCPPAPAALRRSVPREVGEKLSGRLQS